MASNTVLYYALRRHGIAVSFYVIEEQLSVSVKACDFEINGGSIDCILNPSEIDSKSSFLVSSIVQHYGL